MSFLDSFMAWNKSPSTALRCLGTHHHKYGAAETKNTTKREYLQVTNTRQGCNLTVISNEQIDLHRLILCPTPQGHGTSAILSDRAADADDEMETMFPFVRIRLVVSPAILSYAASLTFL